MPVVGCGTSRQVHAAGHSAVAMQLAILGVHDPGKLVVVLQVLSGGTGAPGLEGAEAEPLALEPPDDPAELVTVAVPLVAQPETLGAQVNPVPQSASALHGSCHLYMQVETLRVVHAFGPGATGSHAALGGHAGVVPPGHSICVSAWQIIVGPQSESVLHDASVQKPVIAVPASTDAGSTTGQGLAFEHATPGPLSACWIVRSMHVNPFPQSAAVLHSWARAVGAAARTAAKHPTEKKIFVSDMDSPFVGAGHATGNCGGRSPVVPEACQCATRTIARTFGSTESVS
jgi:hypothetical protein